MSVYSIAVTIYATAYIRAASPHEAKAKAEALENHALEVRTPARRSRFRAFPSRIPHFPMFHSRPP